MNSIVVRVLRIIKRITYNIWLFNWLLKYLKNSKKTAEKVELTDHQLFSAEGTSGLGTKLLCISNC